jgi:hypothetical protein
MWKPIETPGEWLIFLQRKDINMQEQLLFEAYENNLNTVNTLSPSMASSGGYSSIYPDAIKVEFFDSGVSQGVSTYKKALDLYGRKVFKDPQIIVEYRSVLGGDCDYTAIYYERNTTQRPILSGWYAREIPCGGKSNILTGPTTTLPYGDYGAISGPGEGYRVTL